MASPPGWLRSDSTPSGGVFNNPQRLNSRLGCALTAPDAAFEPSSERPPHSAATTNLRRHSHQERRKTNIASSPRRASSDNFPHAALANARRRNEVFIG